jgi:hypothetical protein
MYSQTKFILGGVTSNLVKVFISHSSADKPFVRLLKNDLNLNDIETFFDEDSLDLGDSLLGKLQEALDDSSHFLIVLSKNAVNSEWVLYELDAAMKLYDSKMLAKVIPIKYRDCEIPAILSNLIYCNLANETIKGDNDHVKFLTKGYDDLLVKLVRTIKSQEKQLDEANKQEIKKEGARIEKLAVEEFRNQLTKSYQIIGYSDDETLKKYKDKVEKALPPHSPITIYPIILPRYYEGLLPHLKIGTKIKLISVKGKAITCYFAGFKTSKTFIVIPGKVREALCVTVGSEHQFKVDLKTATFTLCPPK